MTSPIRKKILDQYVEVAPVNINISVDLRKKMEKYIDRDKGLTWRAYFEAFIDRFLEEENGK